MPWRQARTIAATAAAPLGIQRVATSAAAGRVLAVPLRALVAAPGFDTAAMDGFAVAGAGPWRVVGQVLAGQPSQRSVLAAGEAIEIATGAVVPTGADAVLPYERCEADGGVVRAAVVDKEHIRRTGEDARPGDELVPAGNVVTAAVLGLAAQVAVDEVTVYRQPRVAVLVTGDEVVTLGLPDAGQVREALSPIVAAVAARSGSQTVIRRHLRDDAGLLREAVDTCDADVVVVTGSSSAGTADYLRPVLTGLGARWLVDGVRCRPGHPQALAVTPDGRWVVGLPGNPFAGLVAALTILEPVVATLAGRQQAPPTALPVLGQTRLYPDGVRLVPVRVDGDRARLVGGAGSGSLRTAAIADALAVIDPDWTTGARTELLTLP